MEVGEGGGEKKEAFLLSTPSFLCFCSRSSFCSLAEVETLATQANISPITRMKESPNSDLSPREFQWKEHFDLRATFSEPLKYCRWFFHKLLQHYEISKSTPVFFKILFLFCIAKSHAIEKPLPAG